MLQTNKKSTAYRFQKSRYKGDSKAGEEFKKNKSTYEFKRKVCFLCGNDVDGYVKISKNASGVMSCDHVRPIRTVDPKLTAGETKRIADRLKQNERAVKGKDGIIRVIE